MVAASPNMTKGFRDEVTQIAVDYLTAGLVPVPIRLDGSKIPTIPWKLYQSACPTPWQVRSHFANPAGIGILTGAVSFGLEVLDFDQWQVFEPWRSLVTPSLFSKLVVVETGGGGFQVYYRCSEIAGNTKLASWEKPESISHKIRGTRQGCNGEPVKPTRIETRGEGGLVVAPGSPAEVHSSGNPYCQILGPPLPRVNTITPAERRSLWLAAAEFDCDTFQSPKVEEAKRRIKARRYEARALSRPRFTVSAHDDFDTRGSWSEVLEPHHWIENTPGKWRRPGKAYGVSASVVRTQSGIELLKVFTTSADLPAGTYGKARAYALLNHGGDSGNAWIEAERDLSTKGYGSTQSSDIDFSGILNGGAA